MSFSFTQPFNLHAWIDEHRHLLKPPVCNKQIFSQDDFIVMVVGGPNNRSDYHYNETPELFYQLEGEMTLKVIDIIEGNNVFKDISIKAGEIFLLPPKMLHSPQRFANSVGLVVEQKRSDIQKDALVWFCEQCQAELYREQFSLANIEIDLPIVFKNFFEQPQHCTCKNCGWVMKK
jgi:3-hydroxyanthranilate 3,4-dioxygenase